MQNPLSNNGDECRGAGPEREPRFYVSGGTLPRDARSYVTRRADTDLHAALQNGELCYILTARQMGKSSLMVRTVVRLRAEGATVAVLDLTLQGRHLSMEQWYDGLLRQIGRQCNLEDEFETWRLANKTLSPLQRWVTVLRQVALPRLPGKIVIFIDEIDAVRSLPFPTDEFFAALRALHNGRAEDPEIERLTFCILGVAAPTELIQDTRLTPFNVGRRIEVTDFTLAEAAPLAAGLDCVRDHPKAKSREDARNPRILERVLYWTGGHPYLTQKLCALVAESSMPSTLVAVDRVCGETFCTPQAHDQEDNLIFVRERLLNSEADRVDLLALYARVVSGRHVPDNPADPLVSILRLSGVVRAEGGKLRVRNRIYERVFDLAWISHNMPDTEVRRQKAAYRRGQLRASLVAAALIAVIGSLGIGAWQQAKRAERGERGEHFATLRAKSKESEANENAKQAEKLLSSVDIARKKAEREKNGALAARRLARESAKQERVAKQVALSAASSEARQRRIAVAQAAIARSEALAARQDAYIAAITLAWQKLQFGPADRTTALPGVRRLLEEQLPRPGQPDIRGFEWHYLYKLAHRKVARIQAHKGRVWAVALSPDGKLLASAGDDGAVRLWDAVCARPIATLHTGSERVIYVTFSPDGRTMASCGGDRVIRLWNVALRAPAAVLEGHTEEVSSVAFSPDGRQLVSASDDGTVRLWDTYTGAPIRTLTDYGEWLNSVAFSPNGQTVAIGCFHGMVHVRDLKSNRETHTFSASGDGMGLNALAFVDDSLHLITVGRDFNAREWSLGGSEVRVQGPMRGHTDQITAIGVAGNILLTAGSEGVARLWYHTSAIEITALRGYTDQLHGASLSRDSRIAALGDDLGAVYVWDLAAGHEDAVLLPGEPDPIFGDVRFRSNGTLSAVTLNIYPRGGKPELALVSLPANRPIARLSVNTLRGSTCALSPNAMRVAFTQDEQEPAVWDTASGRVRLMDNPSRTSIHALAFSPNGRRVVGGCGNGSLLLWESVSGRIVGTLAGGAGVARIRYSEDGRLLACIDYQGVTRVWNVMDGHLRQTLHGQLRRGRTCAFSPDGRLLATAGDGNTVEIWDIRTGRRRVLSTEHKAAICGIAFSPNGRTLATTGADGWVRLSNIATLQEVADLSLTPWTGIALPEKYETYLPNGNVIFSPDGSRLAALTYKVGILYDTQLNLLSR